MGSKARKAREQRQRQVTAAQKKAAQVHKCHLCKKPLGAETMQDHRKRCPAVPKE